MRHRRDLLLNLLFLGGALRRGVDCLEVFVVEADEPVVGFREVRLLQHPLLAHEHLLSQLEVRDRLLQNL